MTPLREALAAPASEPAEDALDQLFGQIGLTAEGIFDGEAVLFQESASMVHRLNAVAGAVWLLCDGETTVESMPGEYLN